MKIKAIVVAAGLIAGMTPAGAREMTVADAEALTEAIGAAKLCTMNFAFVAFKIAPVTAPVVAQSVDACRCQWSEAYNLPGGEKYTFIYAGEWALDAAKKAKAGALLDPEVFIKLSSLSEKENAACRARHGIH